MRIGRQAAGLRHRHPRRGDDLVKHHARQQCHKNGHNTVRTPAVDEIAEIAEKAEPPTLHHDAESGAGQKGKCKRPAILKQPQLINSDRQGA
ncbi:hypothetical protein D3C72_768990 [compost metagenome]